MVRIPANRVERLLGCLLACTVMLVLQASPAVFGSPSFAPPPLAQHGTPEHDGQHDFDFEIGAWKTHLSRLLNPLTGSGVWVEYEGTSVVRKVWDGRANLGELEVAGSSGHIEGLTLRLYNRQTGQWNITWANGNEGVLDRTTMHGGFKDGRGEFFGQDSLNGRAIYARFVFSEIARNSFRFEQAFSADGGKTWEVNWKATFTR